MDYQPPPDTGLQIIFCDESLIVVEKPSGLLSVPGRGRDKQDCQSSRVQAIYADALVVHRLDMSTSGLFLMARGKTTQSLLSQLFEKRLVKKMYVAIVSGVPKKTQATIDLPLIADWHNRPKQKVDIEKGKPSRSHYHLIAVTDHNKNSRLELTPVTGRSHQLRVHLNAIGHPILGDALYADPNTRQQSPRLLLHAQRLEFLHPATKQTLIIESAAPF